MNVYTVKSLAERWGCSTDVVYDLLRSGALQGFKLGNSWRIAPAAVSAYEYKEE